MLLPDLTKNTVIFFIKKYRYFAPFFFRGNCRYYPTCSDYAIQAIEKYGTIIGMYKSILRIFKCNPFCQQGYDPIERKKNQIK